MTPAVASIQAHALLHLLDTPTVEEFASCVTQGEPIARIAAESGKPADLLLHATFLAYRAALHDDDDEVMVALLIREAAAAMRRLAAIDPVVAARLLPLEENLTLVERETDATLRLAIAEGKLMARFGSLRGSRPLTPTGPTPTTVEEARRLYLAPRPDMGFPALPAKQVPQGVVQMGMDAPPPAQVLPAALAAAMPAPEPAIAPGAGILSRAIQDAPLAPMTVGSMGGVPIEQRKPKAFEQGGIGLDIIGSILDMAAGAGGQQGQYWAGKRRLADRERQEAKDAAAVARDDAQRLQTRGWQVEDRDLKANEPEYFMSGRDRVRYDRRTGEATRVYDGPEDYENYAEALGIDPASDEYQGAVQDYVLRGQGPTALSFRQALERQRQLDRITLKGIPAARAPRAAGGGGGGGRGGGSGRQPSLSGVVAPLIAKVARGEPLTPAEERAWSMYRPPSRGRGSSLPPPTASNIPTVSTPQQARALKPGTAFRTPDGQVKIR